jgi:predicted XRE-type DNA-binding protein
MAKKRKIDVQPGSGNVFADLGYKDARERSLKVQLAMEVNRILGERRLAQVRAARLLRIRQPHVSELVRYRLNRFSVERLMDFLTVLGKDVQIRVTARPTGRRRAAVQVHRGVRAPVFQSRRRL